MNATRLFILGVVLFLLGVQVRQVHTYVLHPKVSQFIDERLPDNDGSTLKSLGISGGPGSYSTAYTSLTDTSPPKTFSPPRWLGLSLMSAGAILTLGYPCFRK